MSAFTYPREVFNRIGWPRTGGIRRSPARRNRRKDYRGTRGSHRRLMFDLSIRLSRHEEIPAPSRATRGPAPGGPFPCGSLQNWP